jgi:dienelactone hydrolase
MNKHPKIVTFLFALILPWASQAASSQDLQNGLRLLFQKVSCTDAQYCLNEKNEAAMINQAQIFKAKFDQLVNSAPAPNVQWKDVGYYKQEFEFESLYQRSGDHASNKVQGIIYYPRNYKTCGASNPATLLLHKLGDNFDSEKQIAEIATAANKGIVMLIYLPHFGPRKQGATTFITKDPVEFETNILQTLADVHQSYRILKSLPNVQQNNLGLMGLSLGGMMTLISAGIDPVFDRYATNVGGGDLANIVTYRKSGDVDSQTGKALKDIDWSVDQARYFLSRFDAITWSSQVKNKSILMINAESDDLINRPTSVDTLIEGYRSAGSKVNLIMHAGSHVFHMKEIGLRKTYSKVMAPMFNFIGENNTMPATCTPGY